MPRHALACTGLLLKALGRRLLGGAARGAPRAGTWRTSGLAAEVRIRRDEAGVPHIFAETLSDLGFGLGVATAQDRLWQMDAMRRLALGRLAEAAGDRKLDGVSLHMAGPSILAVDQFYRSLRMEATVREELAILGGESRDLLDGFARGVNAWVGDLRPAGYPPEFLLAGGLLEQVAQPGRAVEHGVLGVHVEVDEAVLGRSGCGQRAHLPLHGRRHPERGGPFRWFRGPVPRRCGGRTETGLPGCRRRGR